MKTVEFDIEVCPEEYPVRGNAMRSGNVEDDRKVEDEILADLDAGNVWAWASVKVTARIGGIECSDYLGCCSYKDEAAFRECPYYFDMKAEALSALRDKIHGCISAIYRAESIVFLKDQDGSGIFAAFPSQRESADSVGCYSSIGQHSSVSLQYCADCEEVTDPGDYANLSGELLRRGYKLNIVRQDQIDEEDSDG